jgi:hypothetical protein
MMTRSEFETFLARLIWREDDTVLAEDLQYLISMAEARLTRDLNVQRRISTTVITAEDPRLTLPDDYHSLRTLSDSKQVYTYVSPHQFEGMRTKGSNGPFFTIVDTVEILQQPSAEHPLDLRVSYYAQLPAYDDAPTWLQTHYWDLYIHACLIHTAPYLREDDRLPQWEALYDKNLQSALVDDHKRKYDGSPLRPKLPGIVA